MFLLLAACTPPDADGPAPTPVDDTDVLATADTGEAVDTDEPEPELYRPEQLDCTDIPPLPTTFVNIQGLGPHEDFAFDAIGNLVGVDGVGNLRAEARTGGAQLLSPGVGSARGTRFLADGRVAVALPETGTVEIVSPGGGQVVLASVTNPNGLAVDLFGNVWAATSAGTVERLSPDGTRLVAASVAASLDGIAFAPDYRTLYFNSEFGVVRKLSLDDDGEPLGPAEVFVNVPISLAAILDGMTTDSCGNLYVARMDARVFRYRPDGTPDGFIPFNNHPGAQIVPAINFGSGVGGFERDRLYAMNFLGGVLEAEIGIEGRWEPHYPIPQ